MPTRTGEQASRTASVRATTLGRARLRQRERGAVMFILSTTLVVLASIGLYALTGARYEIRTAGYSRQNAQTHYLSEYGTLGAAQAVNPQTVGMYLNMMSTTQKDANCLSVPTMSGGSNAAISCRRMSAAEMAQKWTSTSAVPAGSLGPTTFATKGDFVVELSDPVQTRPPPGVDLRLGFCFLQLTATSIGMTQPNETVDPTAVFSSTGTEMTRTRMTAGPVRCTP